MKFKNHKISELGKVVTGKTPRTSNAEYWNGDFPFITIPDLNDLPYVTKTSRTLSQSGANAIKGQILPENSVLMSCIATVGKCGITTRPSFTNQQINAVIPNERVHPLFLLYLFRNLGEEMTKFGSGGTVYSNISKSLFESIEVQIPESLEVQLAISNILYFIDKKIANNIALTKTLEEIAQIIFKSWFIDFDPVKAKMAGDNPVGMDAATAALFPDAMEESEIGLIPKGWSWISVGEIASVIDCLHSKKPELLEEGFPYLQLDTISDTGVLRFENAGHISKEDYDKWTSRIEVQGGDCLITNVGRVGAVSQVPDHFKAAIGRNITALRPKDLRLHRSFLIVALLSDFMKKEIKRNTDSGTILEALNVKNIPKLIIPGPSNFVLQEFAKLCDPIQLQLHELHKMNVNLKRIRDSLLPRLISGELKIPEDMLAS